MTIGSHDYALRGFMSARMLATAVIDSAPLAMPPPAGATAAAGRAGSTSIGEARDGQQNAIGDAGDKEVGIGAGSEDCEHGVATDGVWGTPI